MAGKIYDLFVGIRFNLRDIVEIAAASLPHEIVYCNHFPGFMFITNWSIAATINYRTRYANIFQKFYALYMYILYICVILTLTSLSPLLLQCT